MTTLLVIVFEIQFFKSVKLVFRSLIKRKKKRLKLKSTVMSKVNFLEKLWNNYFEAPVDNDWMKELLSNRIVLENDKNNGPWPKTSIIDIVYTHEPNSHACFKVFIISCNNIQWVPIQRTENNTDFPLMMRQDGKNPLHLISIQKNNSHNLLL